MKFLWVTRGRDWGFQFLRRAGMADPLIEYEAAFRDAGDTPEVYIRTSGRLALRFPDPLHRTDRSGRLIPHEFVLFGTPASEISSVDDGIREVWPIVSDEYADIWDSPKPPAIDSEVSGSD